MWHPDSEYSGAGSNVYNGCNVNIGCNVYQIGRGKGASAVNKGKGKDTESKSEAKGDVSGEGDVHAPSKGYREFHAVAKLVLKWDWFEARRLAAQIYRGKDKRELLDPSEWHYIDDDAAQERTNKKRITEWI